LIAGLAKQVEGMTPSEIARRYPALAHDRPIAATIFRLLINRVPLLICAITLLFIILPRSLFTLSFATRIVSWTTAHWLKMSIDYGALYNIDSRLAAKFVVFNVSAAIIAFGSVIILGPMLWYSLWIESVPAPAGTNLSKNRLASAAILLLSAVYLAFIPDPWNQKGSISGLSKFELSFWFDGGLWASLVTGITMTSVRELKALWSAKGTFT
jgi:hypothetical protein